MTVWIIVIIFVIWILSKQFRVVSVVTENKEALPEKHTITEETVFEAQTKFEKKLEDEIDFPDAIRGIEIYIYRNLMRVWFQKLSGENRYNEEMSQKLRNDWLDYMSSMEDRNTYSYLSSEFYDERDNIKSNSYRDKQFIASRKVLAIEDAFASAVGKEAIKELIRVRAMEFRSFDKLGNLAPDGFEYDLRGDLKPKKSKEEIEKKFNTIFK